MNVFLIKTKGKIFYWTFKVIHYLAHACPFLWLYFVLVLVLSETFSEKTHNCTKVFLKVQSKVTGNFTTFSDLFL